MSIELVGAPVSKLFNERTREKLEILKRNDINPTLATIRLGEHSDDITYERNIIKNCKKLDIDNINIVEDADISTEKLIEVISSLNENKDVTGILILSLLTNRDDQEVVRQAIDVEKDIDCIHPVNMEKVFRGNLDGFAPCAAKASVELLDYYNIDLSGKNVVLVNRSMVIGKPLSMMLLTKDATVTICHTKTKNLRDITRNADVVITAIGEAKYFDMSYFREESIILDIGIGFKDGHLSGDIDYDKVFNNVRMITPVPRGIGGITTSILLYHTVSVAYDNIKK